MLGNDAAYIPVTQHVCRFENFVADCGLGDVITVMSAFLGRMNGSRCLNFETLNIGCRYDVLFWVRERCSGRQNCTIEGPLHPDFPPDQPNCPKFLMQAFGVSYACIPGNVTEVKLRNTEWKAEIFNSFCTLTLFFKFPQVKIKTIKGR